MNQKIIIMTPQKVSDDEVSRYMNFDQILEKRNILVKQQKFITNISIVSFVIVATISTWFFTRERVSNKSDIPHTKQVVADSVDKNEFNILPDSTQKAQLKIENNVPSPDVTAKETNDPSEAPTTTKKPAEKVVKKDEDTSSDSYIQAEPMEGYQALYEYFNKNIKYPEQAVRDSVEGILTVSFIITETGNADKIEVSKSLGHAFEQVAIDLIRNMPAWKPAMLNGKPVRSRISLPLTFEVKKVESNSK